MTVDSKATEVSQKIGKETNELAEAFGQMMSLHFKGKKVRFTYTVKLSVEEAPEEVVEIAPYPKAEATPA